jgi:hypothetical protein
MSLSEQQAFLEEFHKKLQKRSKVYRRYTGNRVHHNFTASQTEIHKGVKDTLEKSLSGKKEARNLIAKVLKALEPHTQQAISKIATNVRRRGEDPNSVVVVEVTQDTKRTFKAFFTATQQDNGKFRNVYKQVYTSYDKILNLYAEKVSEISEEIIGESFGNRAKDYFNLEHEEFEGIAESQVKDAMLDAMEATSNIDEQAVLQWLEASGIDIRIVRNSQTDTMEIFIGSKVANLAEAQQTKARRRDLEDLLADARKLAVDEGQKIIGLPGSDSFLDKKRKILLKKVADDFTGKYSTVKLSDDIVIKTSKSDKIKKNKRRSKQDKTSGLSRGTGPSAQRKTKKGVASSPLVLIRMFNAKLPQKVEENMKAPRLQSRSGRFASSVRVVDVTTTAKGYPSFGYTYQRSPYGVYENTSGSRFASVERDPRRLIDTSMREIAAEMALGRFFTRRV